jgi:hypothetical protein
MLLSFSVRDAAEEVARGAGESGGDTGHPVKEALIRCELMRLAQDPSYLPYRLADGVCGLLRRPTELVQLQTSG